MNLQDRVRALISQVQAMGKSAKIFQPWLLKKLDALLAQSEGSGDGEAWLNRNAYRNSAAHFAEDGLREAWLAGARRWSDCLWDEKEAEIEAEQYAALRAKEELR